MKKILILIIFIIVNLSLNAQVVKDRNVVPIGVTLNKILRLNIVSDNIYFNYDNFTITIETNSEKINNYTNTTEIIVASSVRWKLLYGAEETTITGLNNSINLNNIKFTITNNGIHQFGNELISIPTNNTLEKSDLQVYPIILIEDAHNKFANAGDEKDNSFTINWEFDVKDINSIPPDNYFVNVIFEITVE